MRNLLGLIYGLVCGVTHVVPGLSGGTFLVIFGCYDTVCEALALNFKVIKEHIYFLLFFGAGTIGGIFGFAHAITYLLNGHEIQTNLFFMGLILGGIPLIKRIATEEEKLKPFCLIPFILGLAVIVSLFFIEKLGIFELGVVHIVGFAFIIRIVLYSFISAIAMIIPGTSGAFVLVAFGVYDVFMTAIKGLDFIVLIPAAIGILLGLVVGAKLILLIMKKYKLIVYSTIIGMVVGSVAPVFPRGFGINIASLTGIMCLILGGITTFIMGKKEPQS